MSRPPAERGTVVAVAASGLHTMSKATRSRLEIVADGVSGDAHRGSLVKHRSRVRQDPNQPNLRQVHLLHAELHDELATIGIEVAAGEMGENILTRGINLLDLPTGSRLRLGNTCLVEVTGLRNPCAQLDGLKPGLMAACLDRTSDGELIRKAGVMAVVRKPGSTEPNDPIRVLLPSKPWQPLAPV